MVGGESFDRPGEGFFEGDLGGILLIGKIIVELRGKF